jgi:hypothetical protein
MKIELTYTQPQLDIFFGAKAKFTVVTKGRRFGATHGAAHSFIEWGLEGRRLLWGDTINSNIDRYVQRYFEPAMKAHNVPYTWNSQKKEMRIASGHIDFRSADRPENWEGFGYDVIFLNEAGIILKDPYLYTNAVLPMLMDYSDSQLIAAGVPKGTKGKDGKNHAFYTMALAAERGESNYRRLSFSSYDNPLLKTEDIDELKEEISRMNPQMVRQEIYGEFLEGAGGLLWDMDIIDKFRVTEVPQLIRCFVAIDPAVTANEKSDETGVVVVGVDANGHGYVLEDKSGVYTPNQWANVAVELYNKYNCNEVVAEGNQGHDMVEAVLKGVDNTLRVVLVRATKGKYVRAEPVYSLYQLGRIHHVGYHSKLEAQMVSFNPDQQTGSPDRMDALVWGVTHALVKNIQGNSGGYGGRKKHAGGRYT